MSKCSITVPVMLSPAQMTFEMRKSFTNGGADLRGLVPAGEFLDGFIAQGFEMPRFRRVFLLGLLQRLLFFAVLHPPRVAWPMPAPHSVQSDNSKTVRRFSMAVHYLRFTSSLFVSLGDVAGTDIVERFDVQAWSPGRP